MEALEPLGEYELRGDLGTYRSPYAVTRGIVFAGAAGMSDTFWRLGDADREIAMRTGADSAEIGPDWVRIALFRPNWPKPDLRHWAIRAYDFARHT